jgi:iron complex outermembrane receptor protein
VNQTATRAISRRDTGATIFQDVVWPDVEINNVGGYTQLLYPVGSGHLGGTVRFDRTNATAGEPSDFLLANTDADPNQDDTSVSAAVNATFRIQDRWLLNLGLGRSVRSATTLERYSDRFPAVKFQNAAEFLGNPALEPEKSLEWNLGTSILADEATFGTDVFGRRITDYITVLPDPDLPKRLPLSPDTVFRYVNGDAARFFGYEVYGDSALGPSSPCEVRSAMYGPRTRPSKSRSSASHHSKHISLED